MKMFLWKIHMWFRYHIFNPIFRAFGYVEETKYLAASQQADTLRALLTSVDNELERTKEKYASLQLEKQINYDWYSDTQKQLNSLFENASEFGFGKNQIAPGSTRVATQYTNSKTINFFCKTILPERVMEEIKKSKEMKDEYITALAQVVKFGGHTILLKKLIESGCIQLWITDSGEEGSPNRYTLFWRIECVNNPATYSQVEDKDIIEKLNKCAARQEYDSTAYEEAKEVINMTLDKYLRNM